MLWKYEVLHQWLRMLFFVANGFKVFLGIQIWFMAGRSFWMLPRQRFRHSMEISKMFLDHSTRELEFIEFRFRSWLDEGFVKGIVVFGFVSIIFLD